MADRGDTHYRIKHLNAWFAGSSLLLLATSVWMVIDDWSRPWKNYQREFQSIEAARAKQTLDSDKLKSQAKTRTELELEIEAAKQALAARQGEIAPKQEEVRQAKGQLFVAEQFAKFAKAEYDWERYLVDEERLHTNDASAGEAELQAKYVEMQKHLLESENARQALAAAEKQLAALNAGVTELEKRLKAGTKDLELAQAKLSKLEPDAAPAKVANLLRDFPGLDFIGPTLKVQKVVLANLTFELNFTKKQRIDMCTTCHMGIDRAGYESEPQPFKNHPRLDLYLTAKSPHPMKEIGCTICHKGAGEALDFVRSDHRPDGEEQQAAWEERFGWHKQHHWDYPMHPREHTEAGCVQCHKNSMELIAEDAPTLTKGYRLFEDNGCYACHKVDWLPTKRKPGPTLKNLQAKLAPEFIAAWVADPKNFRPTTRMPKIFNLENFDDDEVISKSEYGSGREIKGREWNDAAVAAVTTFLLERHPRQALPPAPLQGDASRGREAFRLSGCLGCHNVAPHPIGGGDEPVPVSGADLALERRGENEHGPNLRGVATKLSADWLYWWIKDPTQYWPDTRMPNLRLSDEDAADITAYLVDDPDKIFRDVPPGWKTGIPSADVDVLKEQARWFFLRDGRNALEARFAGRDPQRRWDDKHQLLVAVGEKMVMHQGCFSCHEIAGMESMMPIGTELSNWASKTVDKLDFGFIPEEKFGKDEHAIEHYKSYHSYFLEQKLREPRSFDRQKIKNPTEKLRMPWFDFSDEELRSIATFVLGLVDDEVQRAKMVPDESQTARDAGLRVLRQKNCAACHVLQPGEVTLALKDGTRRTLAAEIMPLDGDTLPPRMDRWKEYVDDYVAYLKQEDPEAAAPEVTLRLLRPEPGLGDVGKTITVPLEEVVEVLPPQGGDLVDLVTDYYLRPMTTDAGEKEISRTPDPEGGVRDVDLVYRNYSEAAYDKVRWTFAPPVLLGEGDKLQREWFYAFLNDPMPLRPQIRVRMPTFRYDAGEAGAVADYFGYQAAKDWPARYERSLRLRLKLSIEELARLSGMSAVSLAGIESSNQPDIDANFGKLLAWAEGAGLAAGPGAPGVHAFHGAAEGPGGNSRSETRWAQDSPAGHARRLRLLLGLSESELARAAGLAPEALRDIEQGRAEEANSEKLRAYGAGLDFPGILGPVNPNHERSVRRAPSYIEPLLVHDPAHLDKAARLALSGPGCGSCHFVRGAPPAGGGAKPDTWAPDLDLTRERLREPWVHLWLEDPSKIYPGTSMPANFPPDKVSYQDLYPGSPARQLDAVIDWLYDMDRLAPKAGL